MRGLGSAVRVAAPACAAQSPEQARLLRCAALRTPRPVPLPSSPHHALCPSTRVATTRAHRTNTSRATSTHCSHAARCCAPLRSSLIVCRCCPFLLLLLCACSPHCSHAATRENTRNQTNAIQSTAYAPRPNPTATVARAGRRAHPFRRRRRRQPQHAARHQTAPQAPASRCHTRIHRRRSHGIGHCQGNR